MAKIDINGIGIAYDIIGNGSQAVAITPGGRFSKDTPGIRALAEKLAEGGLKVLIWDRPNCGESDVSFSGETESIMNADTLAGLIRALDLGPVLLVGGSAGSRVSLITAARHPALIAGLFLVWITGGPIGLAILCGVYCGDAAVTAIRRGMDAVADMPGWKETLERNPGNRARITSQEVPAFIDIMQRWAESFFPKENSPVPGLLPSEFAAMKMPVMILRSGESDMHHPRVTTEEVHRLIPGSQIAEPPWGDNEWNDRMAAAAKGEGLFARYPLLAPQILDFVRQIRT
jgi:pimeloyl-ACP methyl ester carboxylesterase